MYINIWELFYLIHFNLELLCDKQMKIDTHTYTHTHTHTVQLSRFWYYNTFHCNRTPIGTRCSAFFCISARAALVHNMPASLSVVNTAGVVYGNVGHLFVMLLGIRPQVEVNNCRVDAACLRVSLLHQLAKTFFDQLHRPNRTASDLDLFPVSRSEQLACQTPDMKMWNVTFFFTESILCLTWETSTCLLSHHSSAPASAHQSTAVLQGRREPGEPCSQQTWWADRCWWCLPLLWPPWCPRGLPPGSELAYRMRLSSP